MRLALLFNGSRPDTVGYYFLSACRALGMQVEQYPLAELHTVPAGLDAYLRIDHGDDYEAQWPSALRPRLFFVSDTHLVHSWKKIRRIAPHYDLMCCAQSWAAAALPNGIWVPFACDPELHRSLEEPRQRDVVFVGTDGGSPRKFLLQALRERYPDTMIGQAPHTAMSRLYSSAKIGFNYSIANEVNMRVFEVLATRTCLVTNALPPSELAELGLVDGQHLAMFQRPEELLPTIDRLLGDGALRERIAQAGYNAVRNRHTYVHRVREILQIASQRGLLT